MKDTGIVVYTSDRCGKGHSFTKDDLEEDTLKHKLAVQNACSFLAEMLLLQSMNHDCTKLGEHEDEFYEALSGGDIKHSDWWKMHTSSERHHLNDYCPEDVNLVDVLEMICDCVCSGVARTGRVKPVDISDDVLRKAVDNTAKLLEEHIKEIS